jgi:hypothetical protein
MPRHVEDDGDAIYVAEVNESLELCRARGNVVELERSKTLCMKQAVDCGKVLCKRGSICDDEREVGWKSSAPL